MKIKMLNDDYAQDFVDSNEGVCINNIEYILKISNQEGTAIENNYRDPNLPNDRWYDITLSNGISLKCIHSSFFNKL